MNTTDRNQAPESKHEGAQDRLSNPQVGTPRQGFVRVTRSRWQRMSPDFKGWIVVDGRRVRAMLTYRTDGGQGVTMVPVVIVSDPEDADA